MTGFLIMETKLVNPAEVRVVLTVVNVRLANGGVRVRIASRYGTQPQGKEGVIVLKALANVSPFSRIDAGSFGNLHVEVLW